MKKVIVAGIYVFIAALFVHVAPSGAVIVSDYVVGRPANGIGASRHNLGGFGRVITTGETTELCVFCHTPHFSNAAADLNVLWNRTNATTFTAYGTTVSGTVIADGTIGSTSLICLSCHDGVTTFDNIVNAPGQGGVIAGGADRDWAFKMPPAGFTPTTAYDHFDIAGGGGDCGNMMCHPNPAIRLTIGTDLSNDHPISMPYNTAALTTLRPPETVISSIDLTTGLDPAASTVFDGNLAQNRWAVHGFISETATIGDLLRNGKVECGSCHDPHFRNLSWDEVEGSWNDGPGGMMGGSYWNWCNPDGTGDGENCTDGNFLRRVGGNTGSALCRTCHSK